MAPSSSSSSISPSLPPPSHLFTPIHEGNESEDSQEQHRFSSTTPSSSNTDTLYHHYPTPLHQPSKKNPTRITRPQPKPDPTVSCNNCRPTTREKINSVTVVPLDTSSSSPNPNNGLFKSLISNISRRSPKPVAALSSTALPTGRDAVAELSYKLLQATKRRDEAILEASKLKYCMNELENKLNRLEIYCHTLKSGLDICNQAQNNQTPKLSSYCWTLTNNNDVIINDFLLAVSESRNSIRLLSQLLCSQLKLMGVKVFERLSTVLKSYDYNLSLSSVTSTHQFTTLKYYLEAVLNSSFYQDFESSGFKKGSMDRILNPVNKCGSNYSAYNGLKNLTWEQVLNKGTKHYSEEFSGFCDRKMSEIVGLLGWNRAWPEKLLEAFFGAAKSVYLVHLLANSIHPRLVIFRVDKGVGFDLNYMEDIMCGGEKGKKMVPTLVKIMVTPGFYVYDNVVKCKVISRYYNNNNNNIK